MNFQPVTWFCSVFYLISQYAILCEIHERKIREAAKRFRPFRMDSKFIDHHELKELHTKVEECEKGIRRLNREKSRRNILIYQFPVESLHPKRLEEDLKTFFRDKLGVEVKNKEIDFIQIINRDKPQPVLLVGLTTYRKKNDILTNSYKLDGTIVVHDDFPPHVIARRRELLPEMYRLRKLGRFATVKYNRLITKDDAEESEYYKNKREEEY